MAMLRLVAVAGAALGCAHPRYYDTTSVGHAALSPAAMAVTRSKLAERLKSDGVWLETADGQRSVTSVHALPPAGVHAMWIAVTAGDADAVEADRFIHVADSGFVPVTVRREDSSWVVQIGATNATGPRGSGAGLQERWGIGPLDVDGVAWSDEAREAVDLSLGRLSREERGVLAGVPFVRKAVAPAAGDGPHAVGARYSGRNCDARIFVFDAAFRGDRVSFVGEPGAPLHDNVRTLLHEYGHAIHKRPSRVAICRVDGDLPLIQERQRAFNARVAAFNHVPASARSAATSASILEEREALERDTASFERRQRAAVEGMNADGPVLEAYARVIGNDSAPTRYGAVSLGESFAESFSLFRSDPAALRRLLPRVHAFFAAGEHLRAMDAASE